MSEYENQHTVPEFHLRHFLPDAGQQVLWQYSKSEPTKPRWVSPRDASAESYFYSPQRQDGTWNHALEKALGVTETATAPAMRRLVLDEPLHHGDRQLIAQFIGLMVMRTRGPRDNAASYRAELQSPGFALELVQRNWSLFCKQFGEIEVRKFIREVEERGIGLKLPKNCHLTNVFERADFWGSKILRMSWTVWEAEPPSFFVISDNPAFARDPCKLKAPGILGIDRDDLNVELGFPLSKRAFLLAKWGDGPILVRTGCSHMRVLALNTRTVLSAMDEIYSPQKDSQIETMVKEHKDFRVQYVQFSREDLLSMWPNISARRKGTRWGRQFSR